MRIFLFLMIFTSLCFSGDNRNLRISVSLQKKEALIVKEQHIPIFYLSVYDFPVGKNFKLVHQNAYGRRVVPLEGVYLGNGKVKLEGKTIESCLPISIQEISEGEVSEFIIMDEKENILDRINYTPYPLSVTARDGANLSLTYCGNYQYVVLATGLKPFEKIKIISQSGPETIEHPHEANGTGMVAGSLDTKVIGLRETSCLYTIKRERNSLSIPFISSVKPPVKIAPVILFTIDHKPDSLELENIKKRLETVKFL